MINADEIIRLIKEALPDAFVEVQDLRGDGEHYAAYVESAVFEGRSRIEQHQMIFAALQGRVGGALRGLTLQTALPAREG